MKDLKIVIRGPQKSGKSRLAYFIANRLEEMFPDQVLVEDPESYDPACEAVMKHAESAKFIRDVRASGIKLTIAMEGAKCPVT